VHKEAAKLDAPTAGKLNQIAGMDSACRDQTTKEQQEIAIGTKYGKYGGVLRTIPK
jgi:hypothetical protein